MTRVSQSPIPDILQEGNKRFREANPSSKLEIYLGGQRPHTAVLCCSDSRVPPEIIFSAGIGELFVVRDAGNVALETVVISSLDYAVQHLGVGTILILGHTHCGAVKASLSGAQCAIFDEIRACGCATEIETIVSNVQRQVSILPSRSPVIKGAIEEGRLRLVGAIYHLEDGTVEAV